MLSGVGVGGLRETGAQLERLREAISAKRRAYNRRYMRGWRADPRNQARERATRQRAYLERKLREALQVRLAFTNDLGVPACGFCRRLPSIGEVLRLRICEHARGGYVEVRIPYCGEC